MKTVKTFSFAFVIVCSLAVLILWIPTMVGLAETSPEPPAPASAECDDACQAQIAVLREEAKQLVAQGNQESDPKDRVPYFKLAAGKYQEAALLGGSTVLAQKSALEAGKLLAFGGQTESSFNEIISLLDGVIAACDTKIMNKKYDKDDRNYFNCKKRAQLQKAGICRRAGMVTEARQLIQEITTKAPASIVASKARVIEALLNGGSGDAEKALVAQEVAAKVLEDQAGAILAQRKANDALLVYDQAINNYPGTTAALRCLRVKGDVLKRAHKYDEAIEVYVELLSKIPQAANLSLFCQKTREQYRETLFYRLDRKLKNDEPITVAEADLLRTLNLQAAQEDPRVSGRIGSAQQNLAYAGLYIHTPGMVEQGLQLALDFPAFADQALEGNDDPRVVAGIDSLKIRSRIYAGEAQRKLDRPVEALSNFQGAVQALRAQEKTIEGKDVLEEEYYQVLLSLIGTVSPYADVLQSIKGELVPDAPTSTPAIGAIVDRALALAPNEVSFRRGRRRMKDVLVERIYTTKFTELMTWDTAEWDYVKSLCIETMKHDTTSVSRREAAKQYLLTAESAIYIPGKLEQALQMYQEFPAIADQVFQIFNHPADRAEFGNRILQARMYVGIVQYRLGNYQQALIELERIIPLLEESKKGMIRKLALPAAHYWYYQSLRKTETPTMTVREAGQSIIRNYPDSFYGKLLRGDYWK
ncbi:MAG: hypothetical protein ACYTF1_23785 [Planctomycetota bacterium]|jgi:tetratricopeptide (TPR) repeat protein